MLVRVLLFFFFSSRRGHTRYWRDWSSDVCFRSPSGSSKKALIAAFLGLFIVVALPVTLYSLRGPVEEVFIRSPATQAAGGNQPGTAAAIGQRVVLDRKSVV